MSLHNTLQKLWYNPIRRNWMLMPFANIYRLLSSIRRNFLKSREYKGKLQAFDVPIIVCGNITLGGTGKTPLVIYLSLFLQNQGYTPGIISRGYGGKVKGVAAVTTNSNPKIVGDEPVLIAAKTKSPVVVSKSKVAACKFLLNNFPNIDIIISDDGLQHYTLQRDIEIAVIDGQRRFGNGQILPQGPLREAISRLNSVNLIVVNGETQSNLEHPMQVNLKQAYSLLNPEIKHDISYFQDQLVHAVAAIGNPNRFFNHLRELNLQVIEHTYPDHYKFKPQDFCFSEKLPVLITEKDAIKCKPFATEWIWVVPMEVKMLPNFRQQLLHLIEETTIVK